MVVAFCGHAQFSQSDLYEERILSFLEKKVGDLPAEMYLGGYGEFDGFAYECCRKYKETHPNVVIVFVTPYLTESYQKNHLEYQKERYDLIIYPEIEDKPLKFAISYRNKYMVEKADCLIVYVEHAWGGAHAMYQYARRKKKEIFNLADFKQ